jgi:acyl-[acyl-carrier-protein]-phospholipid O-acyltransferase / long-chain-fatty-acid--[acyl-carrier-protein] ligase
MFLSLMRTRRFAPLFWCQFFAAFNDNFLKNALVVLILFRIGGEAASLLVTLAGAVFILPFFAVSAIGGQLADRYDKAIIAERLKLLEIGAAAVAVAGFMVQSVPILFVALFLFGLLAALFTPTKYGLLPDHLHRHELPAGNALVEAATFLAILVGTIAGGISAGRGVDPAIFIGVVMGFAVLSWMAARMIPRTGEGAPDLAIDFNVVRSTVTLLRHIRGETPVWRATLMVSWFWTVGAVLLALLPVLVKEQLGGTEGVVTACLALFSVGIGIGSWLASWLLNGRIVLLPTPIAGFVMAAFFLDLGLVTILSEMPAREMGVGEFFSTGPGVRVAIDFFGMSVAAGLFVIPAFAAVQAWSKPAERARTIAALNVVSAATMVAGALVVALLDALGVALPVVFLVLAGVGVVVACLSFRYLPTNPLRDALFLIFRIIYRLELRGEENLAKAGTNAVVVLNHISYLDAALALALLECDPVFAIDENMARKWWVRPFLRFTRAVPIHPMSPLATRSFINAVRAGETLVIFPEGRLTVTGSLMKIYDGAGLIADKTGAPVVPVRIDGIEHSWFTRLGRSQARRHWRPRVTVTIVEPTTLSFDRDLKGRRRRQAAGAALYRVMSDLIFRTTSIERTIFSATVESAARQGFGRVAVEDAVTGTLTYRRLLVGANILGRKLMPLAPLGGAVGLMLPNANGAAIAFLGLSSAGRVPAMINFTAGLANVRAACTAAAITTIVTSRAFVEKAKLAALVEGLSSDLGFVYLEDVRKTVGLRDKLRAFLASRRPLVRRAADDAAAILFTSGSEGTPKGVVLSHRNILANAAQGAARIDFGRTDKVFNVLPLFHSFGLTVGLVLPLVSGVGVYLYPSPLHYRMVPELVYSSNATILFGTDTFLAGYARSANAYDFRSLRYILAGAEPVKEATRRTYAEKFGLRILEGYGVTEASPALALNTPMFNRAGSVGQFLPGVEVRLDKVEGIAEGGRLFVRGPNVMLGYLGLGQPGVVQAPEGGWHDTGDIVAIDGDGFVSIKGRVRRFAKIGGEMISLAAVEAIAADLWPESKSAVIARPDPRKGEALVLLAEAQSATLAGFREFARSRGASDLMIPASLIVVPALPILGSGKVDYPALRQLTEANCSGRQPALAPAA